MRSGQLFLTWFLCPVLVAWCSQFGTGGEPTQDELTVKQILDQTAKTYADCKSYRDSGVAKTVFVMPGGNQTVEKPFSTAFVRPDRFRFEYYEEGNVSQKNRYIISRKGREVQTWWDIEPGIEKPESLGLAIAAATGVSIGLAHTIPALLLPDEVGGRLLTDLTEAKRIEDGTLGEVRCFRIQAMLSDRTVTLWIDKKSFLVRRIDKQVKFDGFSTEETTTYEPVINGEIPDKELAFDPPTAK